MDCCLAEKAGCLSVLFVMFLGRPVDLFIYFIIKVKRFFASCIGCYPDNNY